jgi:hypothetical protein
MKAMNRNARELPHQPSAVSGIGTSVKENLHAQHFVENAHSRVVDSIGF